MATTQVLKFMVKTTSENMDNTPIKKGNLIYNTEERAIYLDTSDSERLSFQAIITLDDDNERVSLALPLKGFYFVKSDLKLWRYDSDGWFPVAAQGQQQAEQIIFRPISTLPVDGTGVSSSVLYCDEDKLYRFFDGAWHEMCKSETGSIEWVSI